MLSHHAHSQLETFTRFFPSSSEKTKTEIQAETFRKTLLPLLNQKWQEHTEEIVATIKRFKDQMEQGVYRECVEATQRYVNSRDFAVPGRYEVKKSWFFSGVQYYGETPSFQKLNQCLADLLVEVPQPKTYWTETLWSSWSSLVSSFSSAADFAIENPMKVACSFLALEAVAVSALTKPHILSNQHFDSINDHHSLSTEGSSPIVNGQIPDQLLNVGDPFELKINTTELFGESVTDVKITQADGSSLPDWLSAGPTVKTSFATTYAYGITLNGSLAYVADGPSGIKILDMINTDNPALLGSFITTDAHQMIIRGNVAYVADGTGGLRVIDVSNMANPILRGSLTTIGPHGVAIKGKIAYVADNWGGLKTIDISNPTNPTLVGTFVTYSAIRITVNGNLAYVADAYAGLKIIDVTNPANPILRGSLATTQAYEIVVDNKMAYVADCSGGVRIVDLTSIWQMYGVPSISKQRFQLTVNAISSALQTVSKNLQLTTDYFPTSVNTLKDQSVRPDEKLILSISTDTIFRDKDTGDTSALSVQIRGYGGVLPPSIQLSIKPFVVGSFPAKFCTKEVVVNGNLAYLANDAEGLKILDVGDPVNPVLRGSLAGVFANGVAVKGHVVYVASGNAGLKIVDAGEVSNPILRGSVVTTYAIKLVVRGNIAYVADGSGGLKIIDVSNVARPVLRGSYDMDSANMIAINGNLAYVVGSVTGLKIIDISDDTHPVLKKNLPMERAVGVAVNKNLAYVCNDGGLKIIDVSNTSEPILLSNISGLGGLDGIATDGNLAFVVDWYGGMKVVDVSNTTNPILIGGAVTTRAFGVAIYGNFAYVADFMGGLKIIDITNYQLTFNPSHDDEGNYEIVVTATDPLFATANTSFTLRVEGAPRLKNPLPSQNAIIGQSFSYFVPQGTFWDPNNDVITYEAKSSNGGQLPPFLSFNPSSATFWGHPLPSDKGSYNITIFASDRITTPTPASFYLAVHYAPTRNKPISNQIADIGKPFVFTLPADTFEDKDGNCLTYNATQSNQAPLPGWLTFDNQRMTFKGIPQAMNQSLSITVTANDGQEGQVSDSFDLKVEHFPRLVQSIGTVYAAVGHTFTFNAFSYFEDEDSEILQFSATSNGKTLPRGLTFDINGCKFSGTPEVQDKGVIPINLIATDPWGGNVEVLFNLTVDDYTKVVYAPNPLGVTIGNQPPSLTDPLLQQSATAGVAIEFSIKNAFKDPDGDQLRYMANLGEAADWLGLDETTGRFSGIPSSKDAATYSTRRYTIGVTAMDPANETAAGSFEVQLLGPSLTEKILNAIWVASGLAIALYGYYQKKYLFWNCCRRSQYKKPDVYIDREQMKMGQIKEIYRVDYPSDRIKSIIVTTIKDRRCIKRDSCCFNGFKNTDEYNLPVRVSFHVFDWLMYDRLNNRFLVIAPGPNEETLHEDIEIQIRGADNRIMEQFTIKVRERNETRPTIAVLPDKSLDIGLEEKQPSRAYSLPNVVANAPVSMSALSSSSISSSSSSAVLMMSTGLFNSKQDTPMSGKMSARKPAIQSESSSALDIPLLRAT